MKEILRQILTDNPPTRDSAIHLASVYYSDVVPNYFCTTAIHLLRLMHRKEIPTMDSISRCSRLLQEKHPELRGEEWNKRQRKAEEVKQDAVNNQLFES